MDKACAILLLLLIHFVLILYKLLCYMGNETQDVLLLEK